MRPKLKNKYNIQKHEQHARAFEFTPKGHNEDFTYPPSTLSVVPVM